MTTKNLEANLTLNLGKPQPALSSTSDAPTEIQSGPALSVSGSEIDAVAAAVSTPTPTPAPTPSPTEAPKVEGEEEKPPTPTEAPKVEDKDDKTPPWMKAEITKVRNQQRASDARAAAAEKMAQEATDRLNLALEALAKNGKEATPEELARPDKTKFDDPQAYEDALIEWAGKTAAEAAKVDAQREFEAKTENERREQSQREQRENHEKLVTTFNERRDKLAQEVPDYHEVAEADDVQISFPMSHVILTSEIGPEIAYHLGTHKDEAARIANLIVPNQYIPGPDGKPVLVDGVDVNGNPTKVPIPLPDLPRQMFEMGVLVAKIQAEKASKPKMTNTPPPPRREGGTNNATPPDFNEMSVEEYAKATGRSR